MQRRRFRLVVGALFVFLVMPRVGFADFDLTGGWTVTLQSIVGPLDGHFVFAQSGTQLDLTWTVQGGAPQGPYHGTIDPAAGTFDIPLPDSSYPISCSGNHLSGTTAPDGQSIQGNWVANFFNIRFCLNGGGPYAGTRDVCGNGTVEAGETCDDGNTADGDCCAADCSSAAPDDTPCDDADGCTTGERCAGGACVPISTLVCDPCETCTVDGCTLPLDLGCQSARAAGGSSIMLRHDADPTKELLTWKWKSSAAVSVADFGDPLANTAYTICVLDRSGGVPTVRMSRTAPAGDTCGTKSCWKSKTTGFAYKDPDGTPGGLRAMSLGSGTAPGRGKIGVKGKSWNLSVPNGPWASPVTVRLLRRDSPQCWEATYSTLDTNANGKLKAKSD